MTDTGGLNFRRYDDGDVEYDDRTEDIFQASWSHKCPTYIHQTAPCQGSCPSGHDIRGWLAIARGQDKPPSDMPWQQYAFERMVTANPFPSMMGRVCPAPCQDGCNRNEVEDFVGINSVEQYVGDWAIDNGLKLPEITAKNTGKKIAVIGGGVSGLAAAYFLRQKGHSVTIFEAHKHLGGMARYGIPGYRTPRELLDAEVNRILETGVVAKTSTKVGEDVSLANLENDYDAIYWALGAQSGRPLPIPGAEATNSITGVSFLKAFNEGRLAHVNGPVIVVGGGDTSVDVASVARRLGQIETPHEHDRVEAVVINKTAHDVASTVAKQNIDVVLTSLFPINNMMAAQREIDDAIREGIDIKGGIMPLEAILDDNGRVKAVKYCECDMDGMKPIPKEGSEFELECDLLVSAIGQSGALEGLEELDDNNTGFLDTDAVFKVKGHEKHYAGGDIIRPHLLTTAIGHASIASETIDADLSGDVVAKRPKVDVHHFRLIDELKQRDKTPSEYNKEPVRGTSDANFAIHNYEDRGTKEIITHKKLFLGHFENTQRNKRHEIHIDEESVLGNFDERTVSLSEEEAVKEATRCMSCGMCFECDNCVIFCPQDAVYRVKRTEATLGRYVDTDYSRCIGCHICHDVCPTGYIQMGLGE